MPGPFLLQLQLLLLLLLPFRPRTKADRTVMIMPRPSVPKTALKTHLPPRDEAMRRATQTVCVALTIAVIAVAARIIAVWP